MLSEPRDAVVAPCLTCHPCGHPCVTLVVVSSAYISFKNGAVSKLHLPNTIDTRQTMTSKISLDADHVMKMHSIELVEGAAQGSRDGGTCPSPPACQD